MIAGLLSEEMSEVVDKYPLLGDIPVLGSLFRSSNFQKKETELVMIVTPRIVKPLGPGPYPLPTDHFIEPSAFGFYLLGQLEARAEPEPIPPPAGQPQTSSAEVRVPEFGGIIGGAGHRVPSGPLEVER